MMPRPSRDFPREGLCDAVLVGIALVLRKCLAPSTANVRAWRALERQERQDSKQLLENFNTGTTNTVRYSTVLVLLSKY